MNTVLVEIDNKTAKDNPIKPKNSPSTTMNSLFVVLGSILLAVVAIILAPILVPVFFPKYSEGIPALQVLVLSIIPASINTIYHSKLLAKESTKIGFEIIVRMGSLLLFIVVLGEFFGLIGLSFAVLLSISTNTVFIYFLYQRENRVASKA